MNFFDKAYNAMEETEDIQTIFDCARNYFAGKRTEQPVWEILTDKTVKIEKDITPFLHKT